MVIISLASSPSFSLYLCNADDIKAAFGTEKCLKHLLRLSQSDDKQTVEYAVNALINLARYGI